MFNSLGSLIFRLLERSHIKSNEQRFKRRYDIHPSFKLNKRNVLLRGKGSISGGESSYVGHNTAIESAPGCSVHIGKYNKISHNVRFYTTSANPEQDFTQPPLDNYSKSIHLGDGIWIGANCVILPGVTIGDNAVIGANSVVTKDVPANAIYGGVPARLIRMKDESVSVLT